MLAGGAVGDERSGCGTREGADRRGGAGSACALGAAARSQSRAGERSRFSLASRRVKRWKALYRLDTVSSAVVLELQIPIEPNLLANSRFMSNCFIQSLT